MAKSAAPRCATSRAARFAYAALVVGAVALASPLAPVSLGQSVPTPRARKDAFLEQSRFRRLASPVLSGEGESSISADLTLRYNVADNGPGNLDDLRRQLQAISLADRFVRTKEDRAELSAIARTFEVVWSGSTNGYLTDQRRELDQRLETLLQKLAARIRRAAQDELAELIQQSIGDFRWVYREAVGQVRESIVHERGVLRHQFEACLQQIAGSVRQHTSEFYASGFEDLERLQLDALKGCRRDAPVEILRDRLARAEKAVGEIRGRVLFDLVASIGVPKKSLETSVDRADARCAVMEKEAISRLDELEAEYRGAVKRKHHRYARDLSGVLELRSSGPPTTDEILLIRSRVAGILKNVSASIVNDLRAEWSKRPREIESNLAKELSSQRGNLLKMFRFEKLAVDDAVRAAVDHAEKQVKETVASAQRDFKTFSNEHAFGREPWNATPFEDLGPAAIYRDVGCELESNLRLSFARRWLSQRGEDLEQQFQLIRLVHRFTTRDEIDTDEFRALVRAFNTVWTRSEIDDRAYRRVDQNLRGLLADAAPALREASLVGLETVLLNEQIIWRRAYQAEIAKLRATASQVTDRNVESSKEVVRVQQVVAQECGLLTKLFETALGELEVSFYDAADPKELGLASTGTAQASEARKIFETARESVSELVERTITDFRRGGAERYSASRLAIDRSAHKNRSELELALAELTELDSAVQKRIDASRTSSVESLGALWEQISDRSVYQFAQLIEELRASHADAATAVNTTRDVRNLKSLGAKLRGSWENDSSDSTTKSFEEAMRSRRAELRVELRHIVGDAKQSIHSKVRR